MSLHKTRQKAGRPPKISAKAILDSASSLLMESGEKGFSMRKLAISMNIGLSSLYHYYPSKDGLFTALADSTIEQLWHDVTLTGPGWGGKLHHWAFGLARQLSLNNYLAWLFSQASPTILLRELEKLAIIIEESGMPRPQALLMAQSLLWTVVSFQFMSTEPSLQKFVDEKRTANNSSDHKHLEVLETVATEQFDELIALTIENQIRGLEMYANRENCS